MQAARQRRYYDRPAAAAAMEERLQDAQKERKHVCVCVCWEGGWGVAALGDKSKILPESPATHRGKRDVLEGRGGRGGRGDKHARPAPANDIRACVAASPPSKCVASCSAALAGSWRRARARAKPSFIFLAPRWLLSRPTRPSCRQWKRGDLMAQHEDAYAALPPPLILFPRP